MSLTSVFWTCCSDQVLNVSDNHFRHLPPWIGSLERLSSLAVANNKLSELPESLGTLKHLVRLDVRGNTKLTLRKLPAGLARVPPLEELIMDESQLGCVPQDAVEKGTPGLLAILAEGMLSCEFYFWSWLFTSHCKYRET